MDLLSLRTAAGGGSIDGHSAAGLVAAGFTLLQRSPALVRALAGRRAAILMPASPRFLVALAAADGRGAVLIDPRTDALEVARRLSDENVGAVLTSAEFAGSLPAGIAHALLDDAPAHATVVTGDGAAARVDLGSHFGLEVEGDSDAEGRSEECAIVHAVDASGSADRMALSHRDLFADARRAVEAVALTREDRVLSAAPFAQRTGLGFAAIAPLFVGARVTTCPRPDATAMLDRLATEDVSVLVGEAATFGALLAEAARRPRFSAPRLRVCVCSDALTDPALPGRWLDATAARLLPAFTAVATR